LSVWYIAHFYVETLRLAVVGVETDADTDGFMSVFASDLFEIFYDCSRDSLATSGRSDDEVVDFWNALLSSGVVMAQWTFFFALSCSVRGDRPR
jgi:hypothetical protein